jgi:hypothetical protein
METALKGLEKAIVKGRLKDRNQMERRLGKIQARHPQVNDLYNVTLKDTAEGVRLFWGIKEAAACKFMFSRRIIAVRYASQPVRPIQAPADFASRIAADLGSCGGGSAICRLRVRPGPV